VYWNSLGACAGGHRFTWRQQDIATDELIFTGHVVNGIGKHNGLVVPGRNALDDAPSDLPEILYPGSLNFLVSAYPLEFAQRGSVECVKIFDASGLLLSIFAWSIVNSGRKLVVREAREIDQ
jgi:hypothetical protein